MAGRRPSPPSLHHLQPRPLPPRYFPHRDGLCSRGCPSPLHAPLGCQNQPPAIKGALSLRHIIVDLIPPQSRTVSCRHPHARVSSFHYTYRRRETQKTCVTPKLFLAFVLLLFVPPNHSRRIIAKAGPAIDGIRGSIANLLYYSMANNHPQ